MKRTRPNFLLLTLIVIAFGYGLYFFVNTSSNLTLDGQEISDITLDEIEELEEHRPPLELFVIDRENMPEDKGVKGTSYTATIYVVDNVKKSTYGPYDGSSYPNSRETPEGSDRPNTANAEMHLFYNKYGHRGSTVKGLNLVNDYDERYTPGYSWSKKDARMQYVNVHRGFSDKGNYNSRGSLGCITIHPNQVKKFWSHFDFSIPRRNLETPKVYTKGKSKGVIYVTRTNKLERESLVKQITSIYE